MRFALSSFAFAAALAGCAQTAAETAAGEQRAASARAGLERALAGLVPDSPQSCISNIDSRNTSSVTAYGPVIVYSTSNRVKYRTDTAGGCERLARGDTLVTVSNNGQMCRGDIVRTIDPVARIETGSCSFGDFIRYAPPGRSS